MKGRKQKMEKKTMRFIMRTYLIANPGKENETYFSVRASWVNWLKSRMGTVSNECILTNAKADDSSLLKVMDKDMCSMSTAI